MHAPFFFSLFQALHSTGNDSAHPTDYLMFFCLGKKERRDDIPAQDLQQPGMGSRGAKLRKTRKDANKGGEGGGEGGRLSSYLEFPEFPIISLPGVLHRLS